MLSLWYISSGVANLVCLHSELSGWLWAAGNYERMQWWQMERECADQDKTKAETEGRKRRRGGGKEGEKNMHRNKVYVSGWPLRWFSISAGQRERANMIFSSTRQHKTDREGREVTGKMERGKRGEKERDEWMEKEREEMENWEGEILKNGSGKKVNMECRVFTPLNSLTNITTLWNHCNKFF